MLRAVEVALVLPATSVADAQRECAIPVVPGALNAVEGVTVQAPVEECAVAVPIEVAGEPDTRSYKITVLLFSALPDISGVVSLVISSVLVPESLAASRSSDAGAFGAVISIVTVNALEAELTLPAGSVATIVIE
tara:strand:- start:220 stop:624 length:405 start_codon:yes stop_codon:yes gene_type:complete